MLQDWIRALAVTHGSEWVASGMKGFGETCQWFGFADPLAASL
ncbi:hypothetical protein SPHINGOR109_30177 [Sphingorhabdus sp. 109]|nr:hypothetical protein SPHINGOR109_30177 [Sphingorhabdus sp. 109]